MKAALLIILAIPACAIAYYFAVALPANERARLDFEREKYDKKNADDEVAKARAESDRSLNEIWLNSYIDGAGDNYWAYVKLNKSSERKDKDGGSIYTAPTQVWETADRRKKDAVAECHKQHDK